ncbi:MAG: hypothetical protein R3F62_25845 [Planctomycetota bacterium]
MNDAWAAARLVDPAWRGAESEGRLLAEAFTAAVIADVKDRDPTRSRSRRCSSTRSPTPRELLEGLVAAGCRWATARPRSSRSTSSTCACTR